MIGDRRLERLYPAFTAKERAVLTLKAQRDGRPEDVMVRITMPQSQSDEYYRLLRLVHAANTGLAPVLLMMREQVTQLELRHAWLVTLRLWGEDAATVRSYIAMCTKEPVTDSGLKRLHEEARAEWMPLGECAAIATDEYDGWQPEDYVDGDAGREVRDEAWDRVLGEKRAELRRLADAGQLQVRGKGARLKAQAGAFFERLGQPVPVFPDWGLEYEVYQDAQAEEVETLQRMRRRVQDVLASAPSRMEEPLDLERPLPPEPSIDAYGDELARALAVVLRERTQARWCELRAIEVAVEEVAARLEGERVLAPTVRTLLDDVKASLAKLREEVEPFTGGFELPEPEEDDVELVRKLLRRSTEE